jgi:hypothetical protein
MSPLSLKCLRGHHDRVVVGFTTTCAISAYHHSSCEFEPCAWRGVLDTTLCNKVVESGIKHHKSTNHQMFHSSIAITVQIYSTCSTLYQHKIFGLKCNC